MNWSQECFRFILGNFTASWVSYCKNFFITLLFPMFHLIPLISGRSKGNIAKKSVHKWTLLKFFQELILTNMWNFVRSKLICISSASRIAILPACYFKFTSLILMEFLETHDIVFLFLWFQAIRKVAAISHTNR